MSALATLADPRTRRQAIPIVVDRDASLLAMLRRGDPRAPAQLIEQFGARTYRLAVGLTRNAEDAEEAVQDVFLNVIRRIDLFRGDFALRTWIYRIVADAAYQKRRTPAALGDLPADFHTAALLRDVEGGRTAVPDSFSGRDWPRRSLCKR
jgi:RNA polymerase sigma-70 factor, ECF subfamily